MGCAINSEVKLESHHSDNDRPPHLQVERVCICSASHFHVDFDVWRLQILREANFRTFGSSAAVTEFPVNSSCLLHILVLKKVDT